MSINLLLGLFCIGVGIVTLAARVFGWHQLLGKKGPMEARFGAAAGNAIHFIAYTGLPLVAGAVLLNSELHFW